MVKRRFYAIALFALLGIWALGSCVNHNWYYLYIISIPLTLLGLYDLVQVRRNILRNYPVIGHLRWMLLEIRPQIRQYFIESDQNGRPFSQEQRELVVHRATHTLDELPFGTQKDIYEPGYEFLNHSMHVVTPDPDEAYVVVGGPLCKKPYRASRFNISAMSFGALSNNAIRALNRGAKLGGFYHNTGEGGLSRYHLEEGGDVVWQIGTGYFGCRTKDGNFSEKLFAEKSKHEHVKMIEIKLSQGAKPGHGGILPGVKVSHEIADIRGLTAGQDAISPPNHQTFSTPLGLLEFVAKLRELSGGKPVGFKLCLGATKDIMAICKAMLQTKIYPDFITVDGGEGGTGAAPVEYSDSIGKPLNDALHIVHNCLVGCDLRDHIRVIASGKVISGFDILAKIALGADICNCARGMLFALGCIQSRRCHTNTCPTGVATQNHHLSSALNVSNKAPRVQSFHRATIESFLQILGVSGSKTVAGLEAQRLSRRVDQSTIKSFDMIYEYFDKGQLLSEKDLPEAYARPWAQASAEYF